MFNPQPKPEPKPKKQTMSAWEFRQKYGNKSSTREKPNIVTAVNKKGKSAYENAKKKAKAWLQRYVRVRDADKNGYCRCVTCGNIFLWNDKSGRMQGCHYVPAQANIKTALMESNVMAGCSHCNRFRHNDPSVLEVFAYKIDERFGEGTAKKLRELSKIPAKYTTDELEAIAKFYKIKCKDLIKERGF